MAVPSSGTLSLVGIRAEIANNAYNANATINSSLKEMSDGTTATINTGNSSSNRPDGSAPHAMSEFYSYDHDISSFNDNKSFDFDGANDYLSYSNVGGSLENTGSISVWVKLDSMSANGLIWQITAEEGTNNQLFILWHNASGVIRGNVRLNGQSNLVDSGTGLENDGNWHHVVMTWLANSKTASLNRARLYVDGSQTDIDVISTEWSEDDPPATFIVGRNNIQSNAYFNGHINDLAVFSDVLTASEVSSIYNSGSPKDESGHAGLLAYYTMEGYSDNDTTVADDSSNSNTLTINNSTNIDSTDTP